MRQLDEHKINLGDTANISNREHVSIQLEAIDALVHAARGFNAEAAH